jgi:hypothetical protein
MNACSVSVDDGPNATRVSDDPSQNPNEDVMTDRLGIAASFVALIAIHAIG